ncbi:class I SAM-dependent methyltransferase [Streptomyces sp. NPDC059909]|uniref:class I SAM-dependent methyltransferase n=1 Tax=Streptomyces sp. NPDC059909 TaxID=3346998 RepID=UPI0036559716
MSHHHHHERHAGHRHDGTGTGTEEGTTHMDWDELAPMLEHGAELQRPLYAQAVAWIGEQLPAASVRRVLDIGSGPGVITCLLAEAFPNAEVVAVDSTPALLDRALARAEGMGLGDRVRTHVAEIPEGTDALGEADLVWAANSLHHVGDQRGALTGFARLLRPGGLLALTEGGLQPRHLPRDIGIGRPGLESRIDAVSAEWFEEMRAGLPDTKAEVEDWRALLSAAGLAPTATRSFLLDIPAPVTVAVREHLVSMFGFQRKALDGRLSDEDAAVLDRLLDPEDAEGLMRRPDCYLLAARTVHAARRG